MINILFVAYEFPPLNKAGIYRPMFFVKYLQQNGINPIVLTLAKSSVKNVYGDAEVDESLGYDIIKDKTIIEVESGLINSSGKSRWKDFLDIYFSGTGQEAGGWKKDFSKKFNEAIATYQPRLVYITAPPFSNLKLVTDLAAEHHLPVVGDFRDAWSQWIINPYASYLHYLWIYRSERKCLEALQAIIVTSQQTLADFRRLHPHIPATKYYFVPNGFEGELQPWSPLASKPAYTIGYVGSFYYSPDARSNMFRPWWKKKGHRMLQYAPHKEDWLYRSPYFFFKAMGVLMTRDERYRRMIKIKFAGRVPSWLPGMIQEAGLTDNVELVGFLSHSDSLKFQTTCDALLITSSKKLGGRDYSIASKTFEYFQMQKPIIAFVCPGAQQDILEESGMALICDPDSPGQSAEKLGEFFEGKISLQPSVSYINQFKRENITRQLSGIIQNLIKEWHEKNTVNSRNQA